MSENQSPDGSPVIPPANGVVEPKQPPKRKKKRRWLWRALIVLPILLIALVLLLPTILSFGPVRSTALSIAGPKIAPNGKLTIDSWSFGWLGGQKIRGITLYDDQNAAVAHLNVETGATLLGLARGDLNLGETKVTGDFDARIDPATGRVNLLHILGVDAKKAEPTPGPSPAPAPKPEPQKKDEPAKPQPPAEPIRVPDVKGRVTLALNGTVSSTDPRDKSIPLINVQKVDLVVDLNDLEKGVGLDGTIAATVDGKPARIVVKGNADAIENHVVVTDLDKISGDLSLAIEQLDLALVNVALATSGVKDVDVAGLMKGKVVVNIRPGGGASLRSEDALGIDGLVVTAPQLKGDTLALKRVDVPLDISRDGTTKLISIQSTGIRTDLATFDVSGALPQAAIQNLIDKRQPGAAGQIVVKADAPSFAAIARMLPHAISLGEGVAVTGGGVSNVLTIDLAPDAAKATNALKLSAAGTRDGKPIELKETTFNATADVAIPAGLAVGAKELRGFTVDLKSPFATVEGGGKLTAMRVEGDADLSRLYADVAQFVEIKDVDFKGKLGFAVSTDGDPTDLANPLGVKLNFNATGLTFAQAGKSMLANDAIDGSVRALYKRTEAAHVVTVNEFVAKSDTGLFEARIGKNPAWVAVPVDSPAGKAARTVGGEGQLYVRTDQLARLAAMAAKPDADPATKLNRGTLDSVVNFGAEQGGTTYAVKAKAELTKLDVGELLKNESLSLTADARLPADLTEAQAAFAAASNFVNVKGIADARIATDRVGADGKPIPLSLFERLRSVTAEGTVPSLAKLHGLATSFSPPAVVYDTVTGKPLPPMRVESGNATFKLTLARDDARQLTAVKLDVPAIKDLSLSRAGVSSFAPAQPITLALTADVAADAPRSAEATVTSMIRQVLASLTLDAPGLASVRTTTPIELTGLDRPSPSAKGVLSTKAEVGPLGRLLAVVSGGAPLPIEGSFDGQQTVSSGADGIGLVGGGLLTGITPTAKDAAPLPDKLRTIELTNDLAYDLNAATATIRKVVIAAPQARDVFNIDAAGTIKQAGTTNTFENFLVKVAYDLPQLWPLVQPIADPTGESIGKIERLEGKYVKTFGVRGSYPTMRADKVTPVPFNEAIQSIVVAGDLQLDYAALVDKGIDVANVSLPISIRDGIARLTSYNGKPPAPFAFNSGTVDLGGLAVVLTGEEPVLVDVTDKRLVRGATLNPIFSNALGKYFNPIFPNATKANARVDVTLSSKNLHLGKSLQTANSGQAKVVLSLLDLEIANPLSEQLLGGAVNQISKVFGQKGVDTGSVSELSGELRDATFTLDRGVVKQNATFMLGNKGAVDDKGNPKRYAFGFAGDVRLADLRMDLNAEFPIALLKDKLRGDVGDALAFAPDSFRFGLSGPTTSPKADLDGLWKVIFESATKAFLAKQFRSSATPDRKGEADGGSEKKSDAEKVADILGGLLGGKEKKDDQRDDERRRDEPKRKRNPDDDR